MDAETMVADAAQTPLPGAARPMAGFDLADPASYTQPSLECDLIMKGGITSGVVYPLTACRLATRYTFRQLGGASAGAIAAAFTAAAEYGRQHAAASATAAPVAPTAAPVAPTAAPPAPSAEPVAATAEPATAAPPPAPGTTQSDARVAPTPAPPGHAPRTPDRAQAPVGNPAKAPGFVGLQFVPVELGTNLAKLFQPARSLRATYALLTAWIEPGWGTGRKVLSTVQRLIRAAPIIFTGVLLLALLPGFAVSATLLGGPGGPRGAPLVSSMLVWLPGAFMLGVLAAAIRVATRTLRSLPRNGFGLCNGHAAAGDSAAQPPLTDWMSAKLDSLAGLTTGPLTFGHLWGSEATKLWRTLTRLPATEAKTGAATAPPEGRPASAAETPGGGEAQRPDTLGAWRSFKPTIDLLVMTTNLTLGRPYQFPFTEHIFFFCAACFRDYFPPEVVDHMECHSQPATDQQRCSPGQRPYTVSMTCPTHRQPVRHLPDAPDLPVVVAARLSLSFPVLVSAVPLYVVDRNRRADSQSLITAWFSDGGIASNFPMHFFDQLWPERPTFGINLTAPHPDYPKETVWRPRSNLSGMLPRSTPIASVVGFFAAIARTMQNWSDNTQLTLPGFRNRVVQVRTSPAEGGLNLKMTRETIEALSARGSDAAEQFEDFQLAEHEWIRYRVAMDGLSRVFDRMDERYASHYRDLVTNYRKSAYRLTDPDSDRRATEQLMKTVQDWRAADYPATNEELPHPRPTIRQAPPL